MKYLPLRDFDTVTAALNFSTPDCHVIGGCDVYTTKAAGGDKKLYKNIENSLESQYESLVRLSTSFSPPTRTASSDDGRGSDKDSSAIRRRRSVGIPDIDLSRPSPFGSLSQITARRTFAYLIATLNASHTDYDFSHLLRPSDFKKERSLRAIVQKIDSTLNNLRPRQHAVAASAYLSPNSASSAPASSGIAADVWSSKMWTLIDKEMGLRQCEKYSYVPDDDPFDGEEGTIWSMHYFFFSKEKKRVCYLHLRGLSVISHSPVHRPLGPGRPKSMPRAPSSVSVGEGAGKRASYWLGDRVAHDGVDTQTYAAEYEDDDDTMLNADEVDDEVEIPDMDLDDVREDLAEGYYSYDAEDDDEYADEGWKSKQHMRGVSEEVIDTMEL